MLFPGRAACEARAEALLLDAQLSWCPGQRGGEASGPGMLSPQQAQWGMAGLVWRGSECGPQGRWGCVPGHLLASATRLGAEEVMLLPGLYVAVGLRGVWWMAGLRQKDQQGRKGECMRLGLRAEVPEPKGQCREPVPFADGELSWARVPTSPPAKRPWILRLAQPSSVGTYHPWCACRQSSAALASRRHLLNSGTSVGWPQTCSCPRSSPPPARARRVEDPPGGHSVPS